MKQTAPSRNRRSCVAALATGLATAGATWSGITGAAELPLPELQIAVSPETQRVTVTWDEASTIAGRRVSNVTYALWDSLGSSEVQIVGAYAEDCDYRLRVSKFPQDAGFGRRVLLILQLFDNRTGVASPIREDTLRIAAPDSVHWMDPTFAGNLGITMSGNIDPPSGALGTIPLTVHGVNSTSAPTAAYFATALNSVSSIAQGLQVQITGPVDLLNIPDPIPPNLPSDTLLVTSSTQRFDVMDAMSVSFGDGAAAPGDTVTWTAHYPFPASARILADLEAFEGYHVWRSDLPDVDAFTLLGEIQQCEGKFAFVLVEEDDVGSLDIELQYDPTARRFTAVDRDVHDDFPYRYAVSTFDRGFLGNPENVTFEGPLSSSGKLYPARSARDRGGDVFVVPNPFKKTSAFQERGPKVVFANLPTECTIRVFTESAVHLATLNHGPGEPRSTSPTSREWDLRTDAGIEVVPGIYLFHVSGTNRLDQGTERVERTGKMIVVK